MTKLGRDFWLYRSGQFISSLGDICASIALAWWVLHKTGSGTAMASIMMPAMLLRIFSLPLMAPLGDRFSRKALVAYSNFSCAFASLLFAAMVYLDIFNIRLVLAISCLSSLGTALFIAAGGGLLSSIVSRENYRDALRQTKMLGAVSSILGGIIGGTVVSYMGFTAAFLFDAFSFIAGGAAAIAISSSTIPEHGTVPAGTPTNRLIQWKEDILAGFKFLKRLKIVMNIALLLMCLNLFLAPLSIILPIMVREGQKLPAWYLGILQTSLSVGVLLTSVFLGFVAKRLRNSQIICLGFVLVGMGLATLSVTKGSALPVVVFVCVGTGMTAAMILLSTQVMTAVPDAFRARFSAASSFLIDISRPAGLAASGLMVDSFGINMALAMVGLGVVALSPVIFLIPKFSVFVDSKPEEAGLLIRQWYPSVYCGAGVGG